MLDAELNRLSERYRLPLVLCYLKGKSYEETARQLGLPHATVKIRLERARNMLRTRLIRRGAVLSSAVLGTLLSENAPAALPATLIESTLNAVTHIAGGKVLAIGTLSAQASALAKGIMKIMFIEKLAVGTAIVCAIV